MEKGDGAFTPADCIGQLRMRGVDIIDTGNKLSIYTRTGRLGGGDSGIPLVGGE